MSFPPGARAQVKVGVMENKNKNRIPARGNDENRQRLRKGISGTAY